MMRDTLRIKGMFRVEILDPPDHRGRRRCRYRDTFPNLIVTVGKNALLDDALAGSAYTVTGPFMGLVAATGFTAFAAADTMSSHAGWNEAGNAHNPTYSGTRKTCVWSAASGGVKALSAALSFAITSSGSSLQGAFILFGTGAVNTIDSTAGTLYAEGTFSGGAQAVNSGDTVNVSYSTTLT